MPIDLREDILARVVTVLDSIQSGVTVYRNRTHFSEDMRPVMSLIDGGEDADDNDSNLHRDAPRRVTMTPQIVILVGEDHETIGTTLNSWRARIIDAILFDSTLEASSLNDKGISYDGCEFMIEDGRTAEGALSLQFSFRYVLRPADLV